MAVDMNQIYAQNPGTVPTVKASDAIVTPAIVKNATAANATTRDAAAATAGSTGYAPTTGMLSKAAMSGDQINKITSQDSPFMQQAKQQGILSAASRGLQNSSIAAGASEAEAVKQATPLALQDAQSNVSQEQLNQNTTNKASEFGANASNTAQLTNAQLGTDVAKANSAEANKIAVQNAAMDTSVSQGNAQEANKTSAQNAVLGAQTSQFNSSSQQGVNNLNAAAENQMRQNVLQDNATMNQQFLSGAQSMDLNAIQQQYGQLIQSSQSATNLYNSYFTAIAGAMNNPDIAPDRLASMIQSQQQMLQAGLDLIDKINGIDFGTGTAPGAKPASGYPAPGGMPPGFMPTPQIPTQYNQ